MLFQDIDFQPTAHIWWSHRMIKSQMVDLPKFDGWPSMCVLHSAAHLLCYYSACSLGWYTGTNILILRGTVCAVVLVVA